MFRNPPHLRSKMTAVIQLGNGIGALNKMHSLHLSQSSGYG